ncbi:hypothetical protein RZS08_34455, partial [Arthrospira platensis SPKY1]|nr:hypothetical protein [Arthrospira platensis SPKY1]
GIVLSGAILWMPGEPLQGQTPDTVYEVTRLVDLEPLEISSTQTGGGVVAPLLPPVQGGIVYSGKKQELIQLDGRPVNVVEKNGRQIFARVPGVFVYDMDGAGNQVNIATR